MGSQTPRDYWIYNANVNTSINKRPQICADCRNHNPVISLSRTFGFSTRIIRRMPHMEHELFTNPEHLSSPLYQWSLFCSLSVQCLVDDCLSLCSFFILVIAQALVARTPPPPFFSNFLFTNLFSIKFLYFFIISSLFPYFNLFVSIFIQSYANIKLHVSTLYRY